MSRVGAWHIGIERLDLAHAEPFAPPLPERHLLAPDGRPVETLSLIHISGPRDYA
ncbi:hypothetical protein KZ847_33560, partial [Pseudomonas aeruginosa]|nr:hypothetical protein [Pseudomonas aeruginosa]